MPKTSPIRTNAKHVRGGLEAVRSLSAVQKTCCPEGSWPLDCCLENSELSVLEPSRIRVPLKGSIRVLEFPQIRGTLFWGPYNKDHTIWDTILGSPMFGNSRIVNNIENHMATGSEFFKLPSTQLSWTIEHFSTTRASPSKSLPK